MEKSLLEELNEVISEFQDRHLVVSVMMHPDTIKEMRAKDPCPQTSNHSIFGVGVIPSFDVAPGRFIPLDVQGRVISTLVPDIIKKEN